jgi:hypothetical protein
MFASFIFALRDVQYTALIINLRGHSYMQVFLQPSLLNTEDVWGGTKSCSL